MSLVDAVLEASAWARGTALLLSANPIHDTGGGQRSAQVALELLARGWCVVFVSHQEVTETHHLGLHFPYDRLVSTRLGDFLPAFLGGRLGQVLADAGAVVVTQVPVPEWLPVIRSLRRAGCVAVYDCIDLWDSELGYGWYGRRAEKRIARASDPVVATAPALVRHVSKMVEGPVRLLPNAFNARVFRAGAGASRPADLPEEERLALYVGALWGGWMDWVLVGCTAEESPHVPFVFVGDHRGEGGSLPRNCHFLGLKAQSDLPAYLAHATAGFLPWRADAITRATSPLKVYEYLAMGVPVVAPDLEPLRGLPGVTLTEGSGAFIDALTAMLRDGVDGRSRAAMASFASRNSWEQRVDDLLGWVEAAPRHTGRGDLLALLRGWWAWQV